MFKTEYRVVWKRRGMKQKSKRYMSLKAAENRVLLMGPEPWKALKVNPDELMCCQGQPRDECGCGGVTWRQHLLAARTGSMHEDDAGMPPLEWTRIDKRQLPAWETGLQVTSTPEQP